MPLSSLQFWDRTANYSSGNAGQGAIPPALNDNIHDFIANGSKNFPHTLPGLNSNQQPLHAPGNFPPGHGFTSGSSFNPIQESWQLKHWKNLVANPTGQFGPYNTLGCGPNIGSQTIFFNTNFDFAVSTPSRNVSSFRFYHVPHGVAGTLDGITGFFHNRLQDPVNTQKTINVATNINGLEWGGVDYYWKTFQKAVLVVKDGGGASIAPGTVLNAISTTQYTFDNTQSYGGDVDPGTWLIEKWDGAQWTGAVAGIDYTLVAGSTTGPSLFTLTWTPPSSGNPPNKYRVSASIEGYSTQNNPFTGTGAGDSGTNEDNWILEFEVNEDNVVSDTAETIILPIVNAVLTPTIAPFNVIKNTNPLTGVVRLQFTIAPVLNKSLASYTAITTLTNTTNNGTTILPAVSLMNQSTPDATWFAEVAKHCNIKATVRDANNAVVYSSKITSIVPRTVTLQDYDGITDNYQAGYELEVKTGSTIIDTNPYNQNLQTN